MTRILVILMALYCFTGCAERRSLPDVRTPEDAVHRFLMAIRDHDETTLRLLISTRDLPAADRDAFIAGTREILLDGYEILRLEPLRPDEIRFTIRMSFHTAEDAAPQTVEQEIIARRDYRRVWRLKI